MHKFQPVPIHYFDNNPFELIGKDWMLITAERENRVNTMTASWGGVGVMWGKNVAYIVVRNSRYTKEFIDAADTFSLSFFNMEEEGVRTMLKYMGGVSGRNEDKIKNAKAKINFHIDENKKETPFIDNARMVLICKKMFAQQMDKESFIDPTIADTWYKDGDYHVLYVAEIQEMLAR